MNFAYLTQVATFIRKTSETEFFGGEFLDFAQKSTDLAEIDPLPVKNSVGPLNR
jgi:hypothetical protein